MSKMIRPTCGTLLLAVCGAALPLMACADDASDPAGLENARAGLVACMYPNKDLNLCNTLVHFEIAKDDSVVVLGDHRVSGNMVMHLKFHAAVKDGAICGRVTDDDMMQATFTVVGRPATDDQAKAL